MGNDAALMSKGIRHISRLYPYSCNMEILYSSAVSVSPFLFSRAKK